MRSGCLVLAAFLCAFFLLSPAEAGADAGLVAAGARLAAEVLDGKPGSRRILARPEALSGPVSVATWRGELTLGQGPGRLFFVDDAPAANWEHPCRFVFVPDAGDIQSVAAVTPPKDLSDYVLWYAQRTPETLAAARQCAWPGRNAPVADINAAAPTPAARRWAVVISGGHNADANKERYYNDAVYFYRTLLAHGFERDQIYALLGDATSYPDDLDGDGSDEDVRVCSADQIGAVFDELAGRMGQDDLLYVFVTDHGGVENWPATSPESFLYLWHETMTDAAFAAEIDKVAPRATAVVLGQCNSGGFVDDLRGENRVIVTASRYWEASWALEDGTFEEFLFHFTYALANPAAADANADGLTSLEEAWRYAHLRDSRQSEELTPFSPGENRLNLGEHPCYESTPWSLGRKLSLAGLSPDPRDPVAAGLTQSRLSQPYPEETVADDPDDCRDAFRQGDDESWPFDLPFAFPFGGRSFTRIHVAANGYVSLSDEGGLSDPVNSPAKLADMVALAPLWDDLVTTGAGEGVRISWTGHWLTVRWKGRSKPLVSRPVDVALMLSDTGAVRFLYGPDNDLAGLAPGSGQTIGVSTGDGQMHLAQTAGLWDLGHAEAVEFRPEASGRRVLYFCDGNLGDNPFPTALARLRLPTTMAADYADFEQRIGSGGYALAVALFHRYLPGTAHRPASLAAFEAYLDAGGRAIIADAGRQQSLASRCAASFVAREDPCCLVPTAPSLDRLFPWNLSLANPGWNVQGFAAAIEPDGAQILARYADTWDCAVAATPRVILNGPTADSFVDFPDALTLAEAELRRLLPPPYLSAVLGLLVEE